MGSESFGSGICWSTHSLVADAEESCPKEGQVPESELVLRGDMVGKAAVQPRMRAWLFLAISERDCLFASVPWSCRHRRHGKSLLRKRLLSWSCRFQEHSLLGRNPGELFAHSFIPKRRNSSRKPCWHPESDRLATSAFRHAERGPLRAVCTDPHCFRALWRTLCRSAYSSCPESWRRKPEAGKDKSRKRTHHLRVSLPSFPVSRSCPSAGVSAIDGVFPSDVGLLQAEREAYGWLPWIPSPISCVTMYWANMDGTRQRKELLPGARGPRPGALVSFSRLHLRCTWRRGHRSARSQRWENMQETHSEIMSH